MFSVDTIFLYLDEYKKNYDVYKMNKEFLICFEANYNAESWGTTVSILQFESNEYACIQN